MKEAFLGITDRTYFIPEGLSVDCMSNYGKSVKN